MILICPLCRGRNEQGKDFATHMDSCHVWQDELAPSTLERLGFPGRAHADCVQYLAGLLTQEEVNTFIVPLRPVLPLPVQAAAQVATPNGADQLVSMLGKHVANMVMNFPKADTIQGLLLQKGLWCPDPGSIADLPAWVIANWKPPVTPVPKKAILDTAQQRERTYTIVCQRDERVTGRAAYTRIDLTSAETTFDERDLVRDLEGMDRDEMIEWLREGVRADGDFNVDEAGTTDYDDGIDQNEEIVEEDFPNLEVVLNQFLADHPELDPDREEGPEEDAMMIPLSVGEPEPDAMLRCPACTSTCQPGTQFYAHILHAHSWHVTFDDVTNMRIDQSMLLTLRTQEQVDAQLVLRENEPSEDDDDDLPDEDSPLEDDAANDELDAEEQEEEETETSPF